MNCTKQIKIPLHLWGAAGAGRGVKFHQNDDVFYERPSIVVMKEVREIKAHLLVSCDPFNCKLNRFYPRVYMLQAFHKLNFLSLDSCILEHFLNLHLGCICFVVKK